MEYIVNPCKAISVVVKKGDIIEIVDIDGGQVGDFFSVNANNEKEFLSTGVTIDINESLYIKENDIIYSNLYNPMFKVLRDDVKSHDLIHPTCRYEMYEFFYHNGLNHPNCFDNINNALNTNFNLIHPLNIFMNTKIYENGKIEVLKPTSNSNDKFVLEALMDMKVALSACSVKESACNSFKSSGLKLIVK